MEFHVTDRNGIERGVLVRCAYVVISIHDPEREKPRVKNQAGLRAVLQLAFHDAEPSVPRGSDTKVALMSEEQARQIWRFVDQHRDEVGAIVIHCESGVSRSSAVAAALCASLGGDDGAFFTRFQPNAYVYRLIRDAAKGQVAESR